MCDETAHEPEPIFDECVPIARSPEDPRSPAPQAPSSNHESTTRSTAPRLRAFEPHTPAHFTFHHHTIEIDMAEDALRSSATDPERRGGSIARAFDKIRAAMKRRSSSEPNVQSPAPSDATAQESAIKAVEPARIRSTSTLPPRTSDDAISPFAIAGATEPAPRTIATEAQIEVDSEDGEDLDEPLLPLPVSSGRKTLTAEGAREMFAQHGMQYGPRSQCPMQEPPNKIRRVEKPIRLRVHWTCHQCSTQFGIERICVECGHHRCRDCARHPPKKVRELVDSTRIAFEQESVDSARIAFEQESVRSGPSGSGAQIAEGEAGPAPRETPLPAVQSPLQLTGPLELDDGNEADGDADLRDFDFTMYARPRAGVHTVLKPKARVARRICHECDTTIHPSTRNECQNCGHLKCSQCPRVPPKSRKHGKCAVVSEPQSDEEEVPVVRAVQRVYRKPRQRVRYTCEHCDSLFIDRDRCNGCGHERCTNCHREP